MATVKKSPVMTVVKGKRFRDERAKSYHQMKESASFTDCVIILGEDSSNIKCHRMVLAAASPYFKSMLTSDYSEAKTGQVNLTSTKLNESAVTALVDYCYLGEIAVPWDEMREYLKAAHHLRFTELIKNFDQFIAANISPDDCLGYLHFAEHYNLTTTKKKAIKAMITNLSQVSKGVEFSMLTFTEVTDVIVRSKECEIKSDVALQACIDWISTEEENRKQHFADFLQQIELDNCSPNFLKSVLNSYKATYFQDTSLYRQVTEAMVCNLNLKKLDISKDIMILGGIDKDDEMANKLWLMKQDSGECEELMTYKFRYNCAVCVTSLGVMVAGGATAFDEDATVYDCELLHLKTMKWKRLPYAQTQIYGSGAACVNDQVFVMGGACGREREVECFDLVTQRWESRQDMPGEAEFPIVCAVGQAIFVLFNTSDANGDIRISFLCYDVNCDQWSMAPNPPDSVTSTDGARAASLEHNLYVVGGEEKLCLCFDTLEETWSKLQSPSQMHSYGSVVAMGNSILLCGGKNADDDNREENEDDEKDDVHNGNDEEDDDDENDRHGVTDNIEQFDVKRGGWKILKHKLPVPMYDPFCLVPE